MKKIFSSTRVLLLAMILCFPLGAFAWGNDHDWNNNNCGTDVPLDGGLSFLIVAGAGYGIKRVMEIKEKATQDK